jgi:hypothetical protein
MHQFIRNAASSDDPLNGDYSIFSFFDNAHQQFVRRYCPRSFHQTASCQPETHSDANKLSKELSREASARNNAVRRYRVTKAANNGSGD